MKPTIVTATTVAFAALLLSTAATASNPAPASTPPAAEAQAQGAGASDGQGLTRNVRNDGQVNFIDKYFPFSVPDNLEPEVAENVTAIWLLSVLLGGLAAPLWAPALVTGQGFPEDFVVDLVISEVIHLLAQCIPVLGACMVPLNCFYFCPVATIAIYDRNLKAKRRGTRRAERAPEGPPALALADPMPAMAY